MTCEFLPPARAELEDAVRYYEAQQRGLGDEFAREVARTIQRILKHPRAWEKLSRSTRRCRTNRFPYGVIYLARRGSILIVAVAHLHRKPTYWRERLRQTN
jgi:plasmid stabilization system protein ParE